MIDDENDEPWGFGFDPDDDADLPNEVEYLKHQALFTKARELSDLTYAFVKSLPDEDDLPMPMLGGLMLENAYMLGAKLAASRAIPYYSRRMELAVLIKLAAEGLLTQTSTCKMLEVGAPEYLQLLRREIEEFRLLFIAWVQDFDPTNDIEDEWGLFGRGAE
ncbi:hypothetical protein [Hymenobacter weizhouensis]|uniref:hypothetical protein n=1 Tax=Hymenobacter sp. YIM 151500-1 TaxID=2987689 RepID=UPI002226DB58|nr:hypothetical protein [Hymenobacter sp. YIM 151500-1]UYZ62417.1 hypothetical protein OIS53_15625 [Hymenobacter sp. YIM 151500-1]